MTVRHLSAAHAEFVSAIAYYDAEQPHLGDDFADAVDQAVATMSRDPTSWERVDPRGIYRMPVKRFPYSILYTVTGEEITIVAVMHNHRRPGYWKRRVGR